MLDSNLTFLSSASMSNQVGVQCLAPGQQQRQNTWLLLDTRLCNVPVSGQNFSNIVFNCKITPLAAAILSKLLSCRMLATTDQ